MVEFNNDKIDLIKARTEINLLNLRIIELEQELDTVQNNIETISKLIVNITGSFEQIINLESKQ